MANDLVPISDEQAKALQEAFKFGGQSLDLAKEFGRYVATVLGTTPQDLVGLFVGDWLRVKRAENLTRMIAKAQKRLEDSGVVPKPISLAQGLPLLEAAAEEDRDELVDLWARLLAAAMDPSRTNRVRQTYIDIVKKMDPMDALVFPLVTHPGQMQPSAREVIASRLRASSDEIEVSFENLLRLGCVSASKGDPNDRPLVLTDVYLTSIGRELQRLLS